MYGVCEYEICVYTSIMVHSNILMCSIHVLYIHQVYAVFKTHTCSKVEVLGSHEGPAHVPNSDRQTCIYMHIYT